MKIVWFSEIKWDYLRTRKQQIITRKPASIELLFLEPFVKGRRNTFKLRREGDIHCATIPFIKSVPRFPWRTVLDRRIARSAVDFVARARIQKLLARNGVDPADTGFIISNIYAADIAISMPKRFLLYDCNDAHASFPGMRSWTQAYFYKTSRHADAVFASSNALLKMVVDVRGDNSRCEFLGNGVDFDHFQDGAAPPATGEGGKPRLGYLGALAPWLDFDAVAELARERPQWEIILVGPILQGAARDVQRLTELPNVFHLAAVSYDHVPEILQQFDVGLIPFKYNELTKGVNPNKLYEYFAVGLPVVATRFSSEVQNFPELVKAVDAGPAFVQACDEMVEALGDPSQAAAIAKRARAAAKANDWSVIAATFWRKVEEMMTTPHAASKKEE